jgi:lipopolysaccharide transport system ATP-binding protein
MTVRLGFAVAAFLEPEILVVDEVLAVGDAEFQKKAIGKMQDVSRGEGRTVLFVSHNMAAVRSLCQRGIVLENGGMVFDGEVNEAVDYYIDGAVSKEDGTIMDSIIYKKDFLDISEILINGTSANRTTLEPRQEFLDIVIRGEAREAMKCEVKLILKKLDGTPMASLIEGRYTGRLISVGPGPFEIRKHVRLPKYIADGDLLVDLYLHQPIIQDFFIARGCALIHIEGFYDEFATPLVLGTEGFLGLESE